MIDHTTYFCQTFVKFVRDELCEVRSISAPTRKPYIEQAMKHGCDTTHTNTWPTIIV